MWNRHLLLGCYPDVDIHKGQQLIGRSISEVLDRHLVGQRLRVADADHLDVPDRIDAQLVAPSPKGRAFIGITMDQDDIPAHLAFPISRLPN